MAFLPPSPQEVSIMCAAPHICRNLLWQTWFCQWKFPEEVLLRLSACWCWCLWEKQYRSSPDSPPGQQYSAEEHWGWDSSAGRKKPGKQKAGNSGMSLMHTSSLEMKISVSLLAWCVSSRQWLLSPSSTMSALWSPLAAVPRRCLPYC